MYLYTHHLVGLGRASQGHQSDLHHEESCSPLPALSVYAQILHHLNWSKYPTQEEKI